MNIFTLGWWSNRKVLVVSLFFSIISFIVIIFENETNSFLCAYRDFNCIDRINIYIYISFLFFSFLFFSFLFLFQKSKASFEKWRRFSLWYLLVNTIIIVITPEYLGDAYLNIQRSVFVLILTGIHFCISWFYLLRRKSGK